MRWLVAVALVSACKKEPVPAPTPAPTEAPAPAPRPPCSGRAAAFDDALVASGAGTCTTDADCQCYPGGVSPKHSCGGITDKKTSTKLEVLAAEFHDAGCGIGIACAAWACAPWCEAGKCTNAPRPAPAPNAASCDGRVAEIDRLLASGTTKCKTDKDCACFRSGISKTNPCGGITDAKTKEHVESLARSSGCKTEPVMCPAVVCQTTCNAGTCGPPTTIIQ